MPLLALVLVAGWALLHRPGAADETEFDVVGPALAATPAASLVAADTIDDDDRDSASAPAEGAAGGSRPDSGAAPAENAGDAPTVDGEAEGRGPDVGELDVGPLDPGEGAETEVVARDADAAPAALPWTSLTLDALTLRQKVGQMLMPVVLGDFAPEGSERHDDVVKLIEEHEVGGLIMSVGSPADVALKLNDLQEHARIPLLVASDLESGPGFRFDGAVHLPGLVELGGATRFPPLMAIGATGDERLAYEVGRITALEARALGIHVPFAPVLDVNNNPANPVINVRSFGEEPETVARLGASLVRGLQDHGALATGKHFPGHGDTDTDSHRRLPVIPVDRSRLDAVELLPFRRAVEAGLGAVMTAHVAVPEITGSYSLPATLSPAIVNQLLRTDLGFDGLVFTDAMDMGAVTRSFPRGEAAVRAVEAGSDVILMPVSVEEAHDAIVRAVRSGRISEARIDLSVRRILVTKERMEIHRVPDVALRSVPRVVGVPEHAELSREIAERSITLLRNRRNLLPLLGTRSASVVSVTYAGRYDLLAGRHMDSELRRVYPRLRRVRLDRDTRDEAYDDVRRRTRGADLVVVSLHVSRVARDDDPVLPDELRDFIDELERRRTPHIVVSFGNPYLISEFPDVQAYMLAWGGGRDSQVAVSRAHFGDVETRGRLPISIPPHFRIGDGLRIGGEVRRSAR